MWIALDAALAEPPVGKLGGALQAPVRDDGTVSTGSSTPVGSWLRWHSFNPLVR